MVKWEEPKYGGFKLNIDVVAKGNHGSVGVRGTIKDDIGSIICAFTSSLGVKINNFAEISDVF